MDPNERTSQLRERVAGHLEDLSLDRRRRDRARVIAVRLGLELLKTIARLLEAILRTDSLEEAQQCAKDAEIELAEITRRYEMRRKAQEPQFAAK
jgi:hypothetical protein